MKLILIRISHTETYKSAVKIITENISSSKRTCHYLVSIWLVISGPKINVGVIARKIGYDSALTQYISIKTLHSVVTIYIQSRNEILFSYKKYTKHVKLP